MSLRGARASGAIVVSRTEKRRTKPNAPKKVRAAAKTLKRTVPASPPSHLPWNERPLELRRQLHQLSIEIGITANPAPKDLDWGIATDPARPVDVADVLSKLAMILHVVNGLVENGDVDGLGKVEKLARKIDKRPARNERSEQASHLESLLDGYLKPRSGRLLSDEERDELAQGFVGILWRDRALPITRRLTRLGTLVDPFQPDAVAKVRRAFTRVFDQTKTPDGERIVSEGLRALGYNARDLFQFKSKRTARKTDK